MTPNPHDVAAAHARAEAAKVRLFETLARVQDRLKPANLAHEAVDGVAQGVASAVRKGTEAVRSRPLAAAGVAGLIGLVMARGWIGDIVIGRNETREASAGLKGNSATRAAKGSTT